MSEIDWNGAFDQLNSIYEQQPETYRSNLKNREIFLVHPSFPRLLALRWALNLGYGEDYAASGAPIRKSKYGRQLNKLGFYPKRDGEEGFEKAWDRLLRECDRMATKPSLNGGKVVPSKREFWIHNNSLSNATDFEDLSHTSTGNEGSWKQVTRNERERDSRLRNLCVEYFVALDPDARLRCQACRMDFATTYGNDIGSGFIHIHHLDPLGNGQTRETDPHNDLIPICPNCHAMVHKLDRPDDIAELRRRLEAVHP